MKDTPLEILTNLRNRVAELVTPDPHEAAMRGLHAVIEAGGHASANEDTEPLDICCVLMCLARVIHCQGMIMTTVMLDQMGAMMANAGSKGLTYACLHDESDKDPAKMMITLVSNRPGLTLEQIAEFINRIPVTRPEVRAPRSKP